MWVNGILIVTSMTCAAAAILARYEAGHWRERAEATKKGCEQDMRTFVQKFQEEKQCNATVNK